MSDRNKNSKKSSSDFLRYKGGKMIGKERNSFEKELQKDPFAEEALEGLGTLTQEETLHDFKILQKKVGSRTAGRRGLIFYRIAASVAVLMVISSIFIIIERKSPGEQIVESEKKSEAFEIIMQEPFKKTIAENRKEEKRDILDSKKDAAPVSQAAGAGIKKDIISADNKAIAETEMNDSITDKIRKTDEIYLAEDNIAASAVMAKTRSSELSQIKGKVIASEDNMPVPGANIYVKGTTTGVVTDATGNFSITLPDKEKRTLVANYIGMESKEFEAKTDKPIQVILEPSLSSLSEVVVVGYGVKRDEDLPSGYVAPQPINGRPSFNKYIEENIIQPDTTTAGQRVVVVINFTVLSDGNIDSLKIIRSPGKAFSEEAIRLIKSGPQWKPAEENGKVIEEEVRLRIVFK